MTFRPILDWWWLTALLAPPIALTLWLTVRRTGAMRVRWALRLLMTVLVSLTALGPGVAGVGEDAPVTHRDLDVLLVIDVTPSMAAEDQGEATTRLDAARRDAKALVDAFSGARFAVVTFGSRTATGLPWSTDSGAAHSVLDTLAPEDSASSRGSSVSAPVETMTQLLRRAEEKHPGRPRLVFYLGDGEQTSAKPPGSFASVRPRIAGGRVLGYGTEAGGRMLRHRNVTGADGSYVLTGAGEPAVSQASPATLRTLAGQLGVRHDHRTGAAPAPLDLTEEHQLGAAAAGPGGTRRPLALETYWLWASAAGALLLLELGWTVTQHLSSRPRKDPR